MYYSALIAVIMRVASNMKPLTKPYHYTDPVHFQQEKTLLFEATWQFVGFKQEMPQHNDYIATTIGGKSVVIQNFNGELKAFLNVCSHRFSQIQTDGCGNRPLRCRYHGWTFNEAGLPIGIPHPEDFEDLNPEDLCLTRYALQTCGNFIFVCINQNNAAEIDLKRYLGDFYLRLEEISNALSDTFHKTEIEFDGNWKIVLENSLESYHTSFIHPETLGYDPIMGIKRGSLLSHDIYFNPPHSRYEQPLSDAALEEWDKIEPNFADRPIRNRQNEFYFLFPNFSFTAIMGFEFHFGHIFPVAPNKGRGVYYSFTSRLNNPTKQQEQLLKFYAQKTFNGFIEIQKEDTGICAQVQQGYKSNPQHSGILCGQENRLHAFHQAYLSYVSPVEIGEAYVDQRTAAAC